MGLHDSAMANITSFAENSKYLVFPSSTSILSEIPLFLKFTCVEYQMNSLARGGITYKFGSSGGGNVKAYITVPVPAKMVTQTAMRYKQDENEFWEGTAQTFIEDAVGLKQKIKGNSAKILLNDIQNRFIRSFSQMIETDFTETILQSGSKRSFVISLYLPCLNLDDSERAAEIARAFEALALPTMMKLGDPVAGLGAQLHFHPPMWFFNIGPLSGSNDIDWTSQPQASVLTNVAVTKQAIDSSSFTALDLTIKPIAYSITLNFQEIETAFRKLGDSTGFEILSRSAMVGIIGQVANVSSSGNSSSGGDGQRTGGNAAF